MSQYDYDLFVIGAGSGGVRAARISAGYGARVGICEESRVGGTCVIRGCVPKKLLVYASEFSEHFADAAGYGWTVGETSFSWPDLVAAKDAEIGRLNNIYHHLLDSAGVTTHMGRGQLVDAHTVEVAGERYSAEKILVATGGRPNVPDIPGAEHAIVSDDAFDLAELPERILIAGGGYIAVEFAGIFAGLGSRVTLIYRRDRILRGFDDDARRVVEQGMRDRGINIVYESVIDRVDRHDGSLVAHLSGGEDLCCDQVMFAIGRSPYTWDLGLDNAGVETVDGGAVRVNDYSRSNIDSVYAVGDVTDRMNLTPVALMEGHAFADSEFGGRPRPVNHEAVSSAVFSQPPIATVGLTETAAREQYERVRVYRSEFRPMRHILAGRNEKAMMKLLVDDASDRVIGLHVVGPEAAEIVQGFGVAVRAGLTKADFDRTLGIHPTSAEELVTMRQPVREEQA